MQPWKVYGIAGYNQTHRVSNLVTPSQLEGNVYTPVTTTNFLGGTTVTAGAVQTAKAKIMGHNILTRRRSFVIYSPAHLMFTDAEGRRVGWTSTGIVAEVPGATYVPANAVIDEPESILLSDDGVGGRLTVAGYANGTYQLDMETTSADPSSVTPNTIDSIQGTTSPGQLSSYGVPAPSDGSPLLPQNGALLRYTLTGDVNASGAIPIPATNITYTKSKSLGTLTVVMPRSVGAQNVKFNLGLLRLLSDPRWRGVVASQLGSVQLATVIQTPLITGPHSAQFAGTGSFRSGGTMRNYALSIQLIDPTINF